MNRSKLLAANQKGFLLRVGCIHVNIEVYKRIHEGRKEIIWEEGGSMLSLLSTKIQKIHTHKNTKIQKHPTYRYEERKGSIWKEGGSMLSPRPSFLSALTCSHGK